MSNQQSACDLLKKGNYPHCFHDERLKIVEEFGCDVGDHTHNEMAWEIFTLRDELKAESLAADDMTGSNMARDWNLSSKALETAAKLRLVRGLEYKNWQREMKVIKLLFTQVNGDYMEEFTRAWQDPEVKTLRNNLLARVMTGCVTELQDLDVKKRKRSHEGGESEKKSKQ